MESLEFTQDTTLSNNGIYEVSEAEGPASVDPQGLFLSTDYAD